MQYLGQLPELASGDEIGAPRETFFKRNRHEHGKIGCPLRAPNTLAVTNTLHMGGSDLSCRVKDVWLNAYDIEGAPTPPYGLPTKNSLSRPCLHA